MPDDPEFRRADRQGRDRAAGRGRHHRRLLAHGELALQAAEELDKDGIDAEVIDLRTLRPLDVETIVDSVKKTNRIVSVEEGWPFAGIGSEIAALMMEDASTGSTRR